MKNLFEFWDWDDTLSALGVTVLIILVVICTKALTADHQIRYYYLTGLTSSNSLRIKGDIDWGEDTSIELDRNISYEDAIKLVERMNTSLKCEEGD